MRGMDHRLLGRTGVHVSPLCLGAMNLGGPTPEAEGIRLVHAAMDAGINLIDTADVYHDGASETVVGKALADRREKVVLATKVHGRTGPGPNDLGNSRLHIMRACEASLRRLGTDYIDLYQVHRPSPQIPIDETLGALTDLVRAGKVRYVGCSTHPAWMVMEALAASDRHGLARYVSEQPLQPPRSPHRKRTGTARAALRTRTDPVGAAGARRPRRPLPGGWRPAG